MEHLSAELLAQRWYQSRPETGAGYPAGNSLFAMLYRAHCRRQGIKGDFSALTDHYTVCTGLYGWYVQRYRVGLNMPQGARGQRRQAGVGAEDYTFDLLYPDDRQFKRYLLTPLPQSGSQDLLTFVLHTAVAFLVPLGELDQVLQQLGFHPLHVRNIHHLAIAYVLLMCEDRAPGPDFDPFSQVRRLYFTARDAASDPDGRSRPAYRYEDLETRMIRKRLFLDKGLGAERFEALVACNREALHMRHSLILSDLHRLSAVFLHIYDRTDGKQGPALPEERYSFYQFIARFCRENTSRKKFREHLTGMIDQQAKHPTRSALILLWLYTYCFAFLPGVIVDRRILQRIEKQLARTDQDRSCRVWDYYQEGLFDVYGFLMDQPRRSVPTVFRGADFICQINELLSMRYGWGVLNARLPFDHYIKLLETVTVRPEPFCVEAGPGVMLTDLRPDVGPEDNVPLPLAVITGLYDRLKEVHTAEAARSKREPVSPYPLKCSLYEQL